MTTKTPLKLVFHYHYGEEAAASLWFLQRFLKVMEQQLCVHMIRPQSWFQGGPERGSGTACRADVRRTCAWMTGLENSSRVFKLSVMSGSPTRLSENPPDVTKKKQFHFQ